MAFESCPREVMEKLNDTGQIYVLEKHKTDCVPGWYVRMPAMRSHTPEQSEVDDDTRQELFLKPNLTRRQSGLHTAPSLLTLCVDFVGSHIEDVESLEGFPEIVGKTLFESANEKGKFDKMLAQESHPTMQLFTQAYGSLMLESANLENSSSHISKLFPIISSLFNGITELNITGCSLGENEDLLQHISHLTRLQRLCLQHNGLTDSSLRVITAPTRVLQRGPRELEVLDLSRNPNITEASTRYILCFKHLTAVDFSGTQFNWEGIQRLENGLSLEEDPDTDEFDASYQYETWGWAAPVVREWVTEAQNDAQRTTDRDPSTTAAFYGSKQTKASRFIRETQILRSTGMEPPAAEPVIRLSKSLNPSRRPIKDPIQTLDEKSERLSHGLNPSRRPKHPTQTIDEKSERLKRSILLNTSSSSPSEICDDAGGKDDRPSESLLNSYIGDNVQTKELSEPTKDDKSKLSKIFSLLDQSESSNILNPDHQISLSSQSMEKDSAVPNPRKKRKIVVVRNKNPNACESSAPISECDIQVQVKTKSKSQRNNVISKENQQSLWDAMQSDHW